jgi:hypothetical protein
MAKATLAAIERAWEYPSEYNVARVVDSVDVMKVKFTGLAQNSQAGPEV